MRDSPAKHVVREFLYHECFAQWLTDEERSLGNALVLLGSDFQELPLIDSCGFVRHNVYSVERDWSIYRK